MADNRSFMDVVSKICEKYSDYEINDEQAVALVERAHERFLIWRVIKIKLTLLKSKIHRATVKQADLHYVGSITIDVALMEKAIDTYLN